MKLLCKLYHKWEYIDNSLKIRKCKRCDKTQRIEYYPFAKYRNTDWIDIDPARLYIRRKQND